VIPPYLQSNDVLANLDGLEVGLVQSLTLGYDGVAEILPKNMTFARRRVGARRRQRPN